jgi:hypothetical protein
MPRKVLIGVCSLAVLTLFAATAHGAQAARTWAGTWSTTATSRPMVLDATGSGTAFDSGTIRGAVNGDANKGTWDNGNGSTGTFEFELDRAGLSFTGVGNFDEPGIADEFPWNGTCTAGPCLENTGGGEGGGIKPKEGRFVGKTSQSRPISFSVVYDGRHAELKDIRFGLEPDESIAASRQCPPFEQISDPHARVHRGHVGAFGVNDWSLVADFTKTTKAEGTLTYQPTTQGLDQNCPESTSFKVHLKR